MGRRFGQDQLRSTSLIVNTNIQHQRFQPSLKSKISVMKKFNVIALLIATVAAGVGAPRTPGTPGATDINRVKRVRMPPKMQRVKVPQPEPVAVGPAEAALTAISNSIGDISTTDLDALTSTVGGLETSIPQAVTDLENALAAAA